LLISNVEESQLDIEAAIVEIIDEKDEDSSTRENSQSIPRETSMDSTAVSIKVGDLSTSDGALHEHRQLIFTRLSQPASYLTH